MVESRDSRSLISTGTEHHNDTGSSASYEIVIRLSGDVPVVTRCKAEKEFEE